MTQHDDSPSGDRCYLEELLACPGVEEEVILRSRFGFMAFHGGSLEPYTDTIAMASAAACGASVYVVRQPPNLHWHIPSTRYRAQESTKLAAFFDHVDVVITVHGYRRKAFPRHVLLGGRNRQLARHVAAHLRPGLRGYVVEDELENIPESIRGVRGDNPVNVPVHNGVQVELPHEIRGAHSFWLTPRAKQRELDRQSSEPERLVTGLAESARSFER